MDTAVGSVPGVLRGRDPADRARLPGPARVAALFQVALAAILAWLLWALDDWRGISLTYPEYIYVAGVSLVVIALPLLVCRHAGAWIVTLAFCGYLGWLPSADTSALKPLLRGVNALTADAGRSEILATIHRAYAGTPYEHPVVLDETAERISFRPSRRTSGNNSEILDIDLRDSRFAGFRFVAD